MKYSAVILVLILALAGLANGQKQAPAPPEIVPVSYGLVIDNSGSYRTLLEKVITLANGIVEENKPGDETFLVTFISTPKIILRQELTENKGEIRDAVENMFIEGGLTAIVDAVKSSADYLSENARSDVDRSKALVLITDGDERQSTAKIEDVIKVLKDAKIRVFVLALSEEKVYPKVIDRLCKETGGVKYTPRTRDEIAAALKSLISAIRTK
jgi:Mg-chelatase subunit ChlD